MITKDKWVEIMRAAGLNDADMHRWHAQFEKLAPAEHEELLKFLQIPDARSHRSAIGAANKQADRGRLH